MSIRKIVSRGALKQCASGMGCKAHGTPRPRPFSGIGEGACTAPPFIQRVPRQRGYVLITALLILVILTLLGVSMLSGVSLQEKMAGNTRAKTRATTAADFVVNAVETLLPSMPMLVSGCTSPANAWRICAANTLSDSSAVADSTWGLNGGTSYAVSATALPSLRFPAGLIHAGGGSNVYAHTPEFFVEYQGRGATPPGYSLSVNQYGSGGAPVVDIYRTTAMATGGNDTAVSVIQSLYSYMHMR
jgi:type IV pilus assembly protein PilX